MDERVSVWSVQGKHRYKFSVCILLLFIASLFFIYKYQGDLFSSLFDTMEVLITLGVFSITAVFILYEGVTVMTVALEFFKRDQREKGRQEGRQEGRKEGIYEALQELKKQYPDFDFSRLQNGLGVKEDPVNESDPKNI